MTARTLASHALTQGNVACRSKCVSDAIDSLLQNNLLLFVLHLLHDFAGHQQVSIEVICSWKRPG